MVCDNCGEHYTIGEARDYFNMEMQIAFGDGFDYDTMFPLHHLCGQCAVMTAGCDIENDEDYILDDMPEGCAACGSDAYPICMEGCPLIDD